MVVGCVDENCSAECLEHEGKLGGKPTKVVLEKCVTTLILKFKGCVESCKLCCRLEECLC